MGGVVSSTGPVEVEGEKYLPISTLQYLDLCKAICEDTIPDAHKITPEVWSYCPWGWRVVVLRCPVQTHWGTIEIPKTFQEQPAVGWVLVAGSRVCEPTTRLASWCPLKTPLDLIGRKVIFGRYSGMPLALNIKETEFGESLTEPGSRYTEMTVGDLHGVIYGPESRGDDYVVDIEGILGRKEELPG